MCNVKKIFNQEKKKENALLPFNHHPDVMGLWYIACIRFCVTHFVPQLLLLFI